MKDYQNEYGKRKQNVVHNIFLISFDKNDYKYIHFYKKFKQRFYYFNQYNFLDKAGFVSKTIV